MLHFTSGENGSSPERTPSGINQNGELEMAKFVSRFAQDESGATAIEYGLIAMLISVAIIGVVGNVGTNLKNTFTSVNSALSH